MATYKGNAGVVKIGAASCGELTAWKLDTSAQTIEDTALGDSWKTFIAGLTNWTGEMTAHFDPDDDVQEQIIEGASVTLIFYVAAATQAATGTAIVTGVSVGGGIEPNVFDVTFTVQGTGTLTWS